MKESLDVERLINRCPNGVKRGGVGDVNFISIFFSLMIKVDMCRVRLTFGDDISK